MSISSILVVDDEAKMRRLLRLMLEQLGHEVLSADDGEAALTCLNERLGGNRTVPIGIRVIGASNRNALEAVNESKLREDLYYRLNVLTLVLPPLCERRYDIMPLADCFLQKHAGDLGCAVPAMSAPAKSSLESYGWPGNVRELENMMERAIVLSGGQTIGVEHLPNDILGEHSLTRHHPIADADELSLQPRVERLGKHKSVATS